MSFEQVPMVRVICNGCGVSAQDGGEYYAWADEGQAQDDAECAEWLIPGDGTHWCGDCTVWDEDRDERVPKPVASTGRAPPG